MTRQEVEQMCREFAAERTWLFDSHDHYPPVEHAHDDDDDEVGLCMCRSLVADGYELTLETNTSLPERYVSTLVVREKHVEFTDSLIPKWLTMCERSLMERT